MLQQISWKNYLLFISALSVVYYAYLFLCYYLPTLRSNAKKSTRHSSPFENQAPITPLQPEAESAAAATAGPSKTYSEAEFDRIEELLKRAKNQIQQYAGLNPCQPALSLALRAMLLDYPELKNSDYRDTINEFIHTETRNTGPATALSEEEVDVLWGA